MKTIRFEDLELIGSVSHAKLDHLRQEGLSRAQSVAILEADEMFNIFIQSDGGVFLVDEFGESPEGHFEVTVDGKLVPVRVEGLEG